MRRVLGIAAPWKAVSRTRATQTRCYQSGRASGSTPSPGPRPRHLRLPSPARRPRRLVAVRATVRHLRSNRRRGRRERSHRHSTSDTGWPIWVAIACPDNASSVAMPIPVASASRSVASAAATAAAPPDSSGARVASGDWRAAAEVRSQDCCTESCPRTSKGWTAGAARSVRRSLSRSAMLSRAAARATRAATAPQLLGGAWQETAGADRTSGPRPHDDCGRAPRSTLVSRPPWTSHAPVRHRTARRRRVAPSPESPRGATRRWSSLSGTEHERAAAPDTGATEASTSLSTRTASAEPGRWPQAQGCRCGRESAPPVSEVPCDPAADADGAWPRRYRRRRIATCADGCRARH